MKLFKKSDELDDEIRNRASSKLFKVKRGEALRRQNPGTGANQKTGSNETAGASTVQDAAAFGTDESKFEARKKSYTAGVSISIATSVMLVAPLLGQTLKASPVKETADQVAPYCGCLAAVMHSGYDYYVGIEKKLLDLYAEAQPWVQVRRSSSSSIDPTLLLIPPPSS
jgi:hypothetical protein